MSDFETRVHYKAAYYQLLSEVEIAMIEHPEHYDVLAEVANNFRRWVLDVAELRTIREVPAPRV